MTGLLRSTHNALQFADVHGKLAAETAGADFDAYQLEQAVSSLLSRTDADLAPEAGLIRDACRTILRRLDRAAPMLSAAE